MKEYDQIVPVACLKCYTVGLAGSQPKGSAVVEVLLWLFLLVPGAIYSVWRREQPFPACRLCGSIDVVPLNSPAGQRIAQRAGNKSGNSPEGDEFSQQNPG